MNSLQLRKWSERQQVLAVILAAGFVIFTLWFFLLLPFNRERHALEKQIEAAKNDLRLKNYLLDEEILEQKKQNEQKANRDLTAEWEDMVKKVSAFPRYGALLNPEMGGIIDYKVALFEVRRSLVQKAGALDVTLPAGLGMEEKIRGNEEARKRMLQLRAVERFVEMAFALKIKKVTHIEPLDPVKREEEGIKESFLEEYPILLEFEGSMETLYDLLQAILEPERVFALKHLRVEPVAREEGDDLKVTAVVSGLYFSGRPDKPKMAEAIVRQRGPMGH